MLSNYFKKYFMRNICEKMLLIRKTCGKYMSIYILSRQTLTNSTCTRICQYYIAIEIRVCQQETGNILLHRNNISIPIVYIYTIPKMLHLFIQAIKSINHLKLKSLQHLLRMQFMVWKMECCLLYIFRKFEENCYALLEKIMFDCNTYLIKNP